MNIIFAIVLLSTTFLRGAESKPTQEELDNNLYYAVKNWNKVINNHGKVIKLLVSGANINTHNLIYQLTPLMHASLVGNEPAVELLLEKSADVTVQALQNVNIRAIEEDTIIEKYIPQGSTALHCAVHGNHIDILYTILYNALPSSNYINIFDSNDSTALMLAAEKYYSSMVALLLEQGANPEGDKLDWLTWLNVRERAKDERVAHITHLLCKARVFKLRKDK